MSRNYRHTKQVACPAEAFTPGQLLWSSSFNRITSSLGRCVASSCVLLDAKARGIIPRAHTSDLIVVAAHLASRPDQATRRAGVLKHTVHKEHSILMALVSRRRIHSPRISPGRLQFTHLRTLPEGAVAADEEMTVDERRRYLKRMHGRYWAQDRKGRSALLDEIVAYTGLHRKYVIQLLRADSLERKPRKARRGRTYGPCQSSADRTHPIVGQSTHPRCCLGRGAPGRIGEMGRRALLGAAGWSQPCSVVSSARGTSFPSPVLARRYERPVIDTT